MKRAELTLEDFLEGFRTKNRTILARAITLVESEKPSHQELAQKLLQKILPPQVKVNVSVSLELQGSVSRHLLKALENF